MKQFEITFENASIEPAFAEGERYETQATNGAGLICDVYEHARDTQPKATFARVVAVRVTDYPYSVTPTKGEAYAALWKDSTEFRDQATKNIERALRAREERP
jgi:hypothetical protein